MSKLMIEVWPTCIYLNRIHLQRLGGDSIGLNDRQVMPIDGEYEVRITGDRDQTEAISFSARHADDR